MIDAIISDVPCEVVSDGDDETVDAVKYGTDKNTTAMSREVITVEILTDSVESKVLCSHIKRTVNVYEAGELLFSETTRPLRTLLCNQKRDSRGS